MKCFDLDGDYESGVEFLSDVILHRENVMEIFFWRAEFRLLSSGGEEALEMNISACEDVKRALELKSDLRLEIKKWIRINQAKRSKKRINVLKTIYKDFKKFIKN